MNTDASVGKTIAKMEKTKRRKYIRGGVAVFPFVLSAQGVVGPAARALLDVVVSNFSSAPSEQAIFRSALYRRLSVCLIQFAHRMSVVAARSSLG